MADVILSNPWPFTKVLFRNFRTDSELLLEAHERWIDRNVGHVLGSGLKVEIQLMGGASHLGDRVHNLHLSRARMDFILRRVMGLRGARGLVHCPDQPSHMLPAGERLARGGLQADQPGDRSVAMILHPLALSEIPTTREMVAQSRQRAVDRMVSEYQQIIDEHPLERRGFFGEPAQGEGLAADWNPLETELIGFGVTLKRLLTDPVSRDGSPLLPTSTFLHAVRLDASEAAGARSGGFALRQRGVDRALDAWRSLIKEQRWCMRDPVTEYPLRRRLGGMFKKSFTNFLLRREGFGGSGARTAAIRWRPGDSGIFSELEEQRDPLP